MLPPDPYPPRRVVIAFLIAGVVDAVQLPLNLAFISGIFAMPVTVIEVLMDVAAAVATGVLLGFHWLLLPSCLLEMIPLVDSLPTWTACVGFVVWRRNRQLKQHQAPPLLPDLPPAPQPVPLPAERVTVVHDPRFTPVPAPAVIIDVPSSSPADSPPPVMRSHEGIVIAGLVLPALLLALWLVHDLKRPDSQPQMSRAEQLADVFVDAAERRLEAAQNRCDALTREFESLLLPGPEPDWFWNPFKHAAWRAKKETWEAARDLYEQKIAEARQARNDAQAELEHLRLDIERITSTPAVRQDVKNIWSGYVAPVLHGLLAFSLVRFSARAVFRFLLLKDRVGAIQI